MGHAEQQKSREFHCKRENHLVHQGRIISVSQETYFIDGDKPFVADVVSHPGAAVILPIMDDGRILLIKQWRRAVAQILIEAPAGTLEMGEPAIECAMRELREETSYSANTIEPMGKIYSAPGFSSETLFLFVAKGLFHAPLPLDEHEAIDPFPLFIDQALKMVESGEICDAKTVVLLLRYREKMRK